MVIIADNAKCVQEMCKHKIYTKTDFRKWALKNHPDKGGDSELFKYISNCVDEDRFCTESFCTPELFKLLNTKIEDNLRWIKNAQNDIKDFQDEIKRKQKLQKQYKQYLKSDQYKEDMKDEWFTPELEEEYKWDQSRTIKNLKESIKLRKEWINKYKKDMKYYKETIQICNEVKQLIEKRKKREEAEEKRKKKKQPILLLQDKPKKQRKPRERKHCKETHMRDPMTCKCIVDKTKKKCPSNKTLNPLTGRCLSKYDPSKKC